MPVALDLVEPSMLDNPPPRRLPLFFVPNLVGEYLLERPLRSYLDPLTFGGLALTLVLMLSGLPQPIWGVALLVALSRPAAGLWVIMTYVRDDYRLLRRGIIAWAYIMGVRQGAGGAHIDCVIPVDAKRSLVGSAWIPDPDEAAAISAPGRVQVICLKKAPGVWRLRLHDRPGVRYGHFLSERMREPRRLQVEA